MTGIKQDYVDRGEKLDPLAEKRQEAKERLGDKWLLHPNNRVEKKRPMHPVEMDRDKYCPGCGEPRRGGGFCGLCLRPGGTA